MQRYQGCIDAEKDPLDHGPSKDKLRIMTLMVTAASHTGSSSASGQNFHMNGIICGRSIAVRRPYLSQVAVPLGTAQLTY